jgi:hypothetical protein
VSKSRLVSQSLGHRRTGCKPQSVLHHIVIPEMSPLFGGQPWINRKGIRSYMEKLRFKSGHTSCPACSLLGNPQEPYMAVPTADDRVYCYACELVTSGIRGVDRFQLFPVVPSLPKPVLDVVMALISTKVGQCGAVGPTYTLDSAGTKGLGFSDPMTEADMQRAAGAVACGNADVLIDEADRVHIGLSHGLYNFHTVALSFKSSTLGAVQGVDCSADVRLHPILDRLSEPERTALLSLARLGFSLQGFDVDSSMRFINMTCGSAREGITAGIHWIP